MQSKVYFINAQVSMKRNMFHKLRELLNQDDFKDFISPNELVALKLHPGEKGCTAHIQPQYVGLVVEEVKKRGGKPFFIRD